MTASEGSFRAPKRSCLSWTRLARCEHLHDGSPEELNEDVIVSMRLTKRYMFVSEKEFEQENGQKLPQHIPRIEIYDENNAVVTGIGRGRS